MSEQSRYFDELYRIDADPWRFGERGAELFRHECIAEVASRVAHERVLEVGCSAGSLTARLARFRGRLVAFDLSQKAVSRAREVVAGTDASPHPPMFLVGSVTALPVGAASFDLVIASDGPIGWRLGSDERMAVYRELHASLSPGGHVLITDFMRPQRFAEFIDEVAKSPLQIEEIRYLHDRLWYGLERLMKGMLRFAVVRRMIGSVRLARALDRVGAALGARGASHILILTRRSE